MNKENFKKSWQAFFFVVSLHPIKNEILWPLKWNYTSRKTVKWNWMFLLKMKLFGWIKHRSEPCLECRKQQYPNIWNTFLILVSFVKRQWFPFWKQLLRTGKDIPQSSTILMQCCLSDIVLTLFLQHFFEFGQVTCWKSIFFVENQSINELKLFTFGASFKDLGKKLFCFTLIWLRVQTWWTWCGIWARGELTECDFFDAGSVVSYGHKKWGRPTGQPQLLITNY